MRATFENRGEGFMLHIELTENEIEHIGLLTPGVPLEPELNEPLADLAALVEEAGGLHAGKLSRISFTSVRG
ncbi:hypothetical protein [Kribbella deserti]|uniref:Uncharacterized protein n=1 Tax=Kribbella deserti TaxID=1926257 RepID=A0ABV6QFC1_9ACTN